MVSLVMMIMIHSKKQHSTKKEIKIKSLKKRKIKWNLILLLMLKRTLNGKIVLKDLR